MRAFYITILFLSTFVVSRSQVPQEDTISFLLKVQQVYADATAFDMTIVLEQVESDNQKITQNYRSIRSGNQFYIETPVLTSVIDQEHTLLIDKVQKEIQLSNSVEQNSDLSALSKVIPNSQELKNQITKVEETPEELRISFKDPNGYYDEVYYAFAKANYQLRSVRYLNNSIENGEISEIKLKYSENHICNEVDSSLFSIAPYVENMGSNWVLTEAYKEYSLINSLLP